MNKQVDVTGLEEKKAADLYLGVLQIGAIIIFLIRRKGINVRCMCCRVV